MFWGCFSSTSGKGPSLFQEKNQGSISEESYREHILSLIHEQICENEKHNIELYFMQDRASGHRACRTLAELQERRIRVIFQLPYSPNLNPIKNCQNWIKDYIEDKQGLQEKPSYDNLRRYMQEAQAALPNKYWRELLDLMLARCQAVIDANGMHTKYQTVHRIIMHFMRLILLVRLPLGSAPLLSVGT